MKLRSPVLIFFIVIMAVLAVIESAHSDPLVWDTPYGLVDLRLQSSESILGYDGILKQALAGIALPVYTDPKGIVTIHIGAGAPWPVGNQSTIQPVVLGGHNILKEIPGMEPYSNFQLNVFGRWATNQGKAGAGIAFSWSFAQPSQPTLPPPPPVVSQPPVVPLVQPEVKVSTPIPTSPQVPPQAPSEEPTFEKLPVP